jgi:hypothetical protein
MGIGVLISCCTIEAKNISRFFVDEHQLLLYPGNIQTSRPAQRYLFFRPGNMPGILIVELSFENGKFLTKESRPLFVLSIAFRISNYAH